MCSYQFKINVNFSCFRNINCSTLFVGVNAQSFIQAYTLATTNFTVQLASPQVCIKHSQSHNFIGVFIFFTEFYFLLFSFLQLSHPESFQ